MNQIKEYTTKLFEDIKHIDEFGNEYWLARELQSVLGYYQWRSIKDLIERAKIACKESEYNIDDLVLTKTCFAIQTHKHDIINTGCDNNG